jgi:hypothetical protein
MGGRAAPSGSAVDTNDVRGRVEGMQLRWAAGPQLKARWSGRYATVLADDPGSSVLTLTSLGMATLCRPFGTHTPSRNIALWKDPKTGGPHEITLPEGAAAIVLTISAEFAEEWSADGRSDGGSTGYPTLTGIHPVYANAD